MKGMLRLTPMTICLLMVAALAALLIRHVKARDSMPIAGPLACACCADDGEWYEMTERISAAQFDALANLKFSAVANRYSTPADEGELADAYSLSLRREGRRWEMRFRDEQGKTGALAFTLPLTAVSFGTDLREAEPGSAGPILYKEFRLGGAAQVTGIFKRGMTGAKRFRLILQGRGNNCTDVGDYKHWKLQVYGGSFAYSFYGSLE